MTAYTVVLGLENLAGFESVYCVRVTGSTHEEAIVEATKATRTHLAAPDLTDDDFEVLAIFEGFPDEVGGTAMEIVANLVDDDHPELPLEMGGA